MTGLNRPAASKPKPLSRACYKKFNKLNFLLSIKNRSIDETHTDAAEEPLDQALPRVSI
jgi:hypothetical protein